MNNHSKKAMRIFLIFAGIFAIVFIIFSINLKNNTAEKYRLEMAEKIDAVYPDFAEQKENFYDLTGIDSIVEKEEEIRNQLFDDFYDALKLSDKNTVNTRIEAGIENIYSSIDMINSKLAELIDMFETATPDELAKFQDDFQLKSEALTENIEAIYTELLK